jgi:hypothetical protein
MKPGSPGFFYFKDEREIKIFQNCRRLAFFSLAISISASRHRIG